jgi:hypothetical protein
LKKKEGFFKPKSTGNNLEWLMAEFMIEVAENSLQQASRLRY